ncbi:MAG: pitrilysin family protein [Chitinophagales bacterium]
MNRTIAPHIYLPKHLDFINIHKETLDNNFPLYVISGTTQNICELNIMYRAGRYFENKKLLASLCAGMMKKGTSSKTAYQINENFDFYGATVKFRSNMYTAKLNLYCLSNQLPEVLPKLIEVLTEVSFPEKEIKKTKEKIKQNLAVQKDKNSYIASLHFNQAIFGKESTFGYFPKSEDLKNINRQDLKNFQEAHWQLNSGSFATVSGNIGHKEIKLINQYLGKLKVINKTNDSIELNPIEDKEIFIDAKNKHQAALRVGMPLFSYHHKDYYDFKILNTVLGGYFGSRLMSNIREEKGYTYGIYSFYTAIMNQGYFCIATDVGSEYKNATLHEIEKEINRLKNEPIGKEELEMVKNYLLGQLMKRVDGALSTTKTLQSFLIFDNDLEKINEHLKIIHSITPARLQALANEYLDYKNMYKVVVG